MTGQKKQKYMHAYACIDCRKVFKREIKLPIADQDRIRVCQNCGQNAYNVGRKFHAPKMSDDKAWKLTIFLIRNGFPFQTVYDRNVNGTLQNASYPKTLADAGAFVEKYREQAIHIESEK